MSILFLLCIAFLLAMATAPAVDGEHSGTLVPLWGRWEQEFVCAGQVMPDAPLSVELAAPDGERFSVPSFWDGENRWRIRFMPDRQGIWRWKLGDAPDTEEALPREGEFICRRQAGNRFVQHGAVRVAPTGRHLQHADGTPFLWIADTAWNGPLLSASDDWNAYLQDRAGKRFSAVQFVMTAPWRAAPTDAQGQVAFTGRDPIRIDPAFFARMDERIEAINAQGLLAVPVMLWAIHGKDNPGWFLSEEDAILLGRYLRARYQAHHVVWLLAGDAHYADEVADRWKRIGRAVFGDGPRPPVGLHPAGRTWPYDAFLDEDWLDIYGYQNGHGDDAGALRWLHSGPPARKWREHLPRPVINLEMPYEDHLSYHSRQPHPAYSVRRAAYWSLLVAPPAGVSYGVHGVWSWETGANVPPAHPGTGMARPWHEAIGLPGSGHLSCLAALFSALPWWLLRPAADTLLAIQPGMQDPARFIAAARTGDGSLAVLYLPVGGGVSLRPGSMQVARAEWFDPRNGACLPARTVNPDIYHAPDTQDWVLVLRAR